MLSTQSLLLILLTLSSSYYTKLDELTLLTLRRYGARWEGKKSRSHLVNLDEVHYYLSSLDGSASQFAEAIRGHWLIENRLHWVKDVTLNEDNNIHARWQCTC